ncbi:hypothetical protein KSP40_PGU016899 [Platanthera guangdongensis]|uniref:Uncharacterized protein n=1 Tax=Platanthera guangdongensis TaxID=2320717 RepID=A0ABR2MBG1_9ASPA
MDYLPILWNLGFHQILRPAVKGSRRVLRHVNGNDLRVKIVVEHLVRNGGDVRDLCKPREPWKESPAVRDLCKPREPWKESILEEMSGCILEEMPAFNPCLK